MLLSVTVVDNNRNKELRAGIKRKGESLKTCIILLGDIKMWNGRCLELWLALHFAQELSLNKMWCKSVSN